MKLHRWIRRQRGERKQSLHAAHLKLLNDIHFDWKVPHLSMEETNWNTNYIELKSFLLLQRDDDRKLCKPGYISIHHSKTLGTWVYTQRKRYQQGVLREDRKQKLQLINFDFGKSGPKGIAGGGGERKTTTEVLKQNPKDELKKVRVGIEGNHKRTNNNKHQRRWDSMYQKLVQFKECHGHTCVPHNYEPDPSLGLWVSTQRREYNQKSWYHTKRSIQSDRKEKLDLIGFVWYATSPNAKRRAATANITSRTRHVKKRKKDGVEEDYEMKKKKKCVSSKKSSSSTTTKSSVSSECQYILYPEGAMGICSSTSSNDGGSNDLSAGRNKHNDSPPAHRLIRQREE